MEFSGPAYLMFGYFEKEEHCIGGQSEKFVWSMAFRKGGSLYR